MSVLDYLSNKFESIRNEEERQQIEELKAFYREKAAACEKAANEEVYWNKICEWTKSQKGLASIHEEANRVLTSAECSYDARYQMVKKIVVQKTREIDNLFGDVITQGVAYMNVEVDDVIEKINHRINNTIDFIKGQHLKFEYVASYTKTNADTSTTYIPQKLVDHERPLIEIAKYFYLDFDYDDSSAFDKWEQIVQDISEVAIPHIRADEIFVDGKSVGVMERYIPKTIYEAECFEGMMIKGMTLFDMLDKPNVMHARTFMGDQEASQQVRDKITNKYLDVEQIGVSCEVDTDRANTKLVRVCQNGKETTNKDVAEVGVQNQR